MQQNRAKRVQDKTRLGAGKKLSTGNCAKKNMKFLRTNKWYKQKPEIIRQNETYKIFWDFEIQTDYRIPARRQDLVTINR